MNSFEKDLDEIREAFRDLRGELSRRCEVVLLGLGELNEKIQHGLEEIEKIRRKGEMR